MRLTFYAAAGANHLGRSAFGIRPAFARFVSYGAVSP
jgi:hypothetical protein